MTTPGPGWHPDPEGNQQLRYWDGQQWTSATQPMPDSQTPAPETPDQAKDRKRQLVAIGIIIAAVTSIAIFKSIDFSKDDTETAAAETTTTQPTQPSTTRPTTARTTIAASPPAVTTSRSPVTTRNNPADDPEFLFLGALTLIGFPDTADAEKLEAGRTACASFRKGEEFMDISLMIYFNGPDEWTPENAGQLVGAAVPAFCPQYRSELPR